MVDQSIITAFLAFEAASSMEVRSIFDELVQEKKCMLYPRSFAVHEQKDSVD
jgi:hypothetical protein